MAVAINELKYIPDLPGAKALTITDLLHISQSGTDAQLTLTALGAFMANIMHPVGSVIYNSVKGFDPNKQFPGQKWERHGTDRTPRVCRADESNLGALGGSDSVTLQGGHMPTHNHGVSGTVTAAGNHQHNGQTSDAGYHGHRAWTDAQGEHYHAGRFYESRTAIDGGSSNRRTWAADGGFNGEQLIAPTGLHTHGVGIEGSGNHSHTFTTSWSGDHTHTFNVVTTNAGSGAAFSVLNSVLVVSCWRRAS